MKDTKMIHCIGCDFFSWQISNNGLSLITALKNYRIKYIKDHELFKKFIYKERRTLF
jgi:hypothetical protein